MPHGSTMTKELSITAFLFAAAVCLTVVKSQPPVVSTGFSLKPDDVTIYFPLTSKTIYTVCMPESPEATVVWLKGENKLVNDNRVSMKYVTKAKKITVRELKLKVREARLAYREKAKPRIHILSITNPMQSDDGEYSCAVSTPGRQPQVAKFWVYVKHDECPPHEYKCSKDGKCLRESQMCNGIADCSDGFDEQVASGCGQPVTPTDLRMESDSSVFTDAIKIRWDKMPAATAYEVAVNDAAGNAVSKSTISAAYPGVEISGLQDGQKYSFQVRSKTRQGNSDYSNPKFFSTLALGQPGAVGNLSVVWPKSNLTDHIVSWLAPTEYSNHPTVSIKYNLQYCAMIPVIPDQDITDGNATSANYTTPKPQPAKPIVYEKTDCTDVPDLGRSQSARVYISVRNSTLYSFQVIPVGLKGIQGPATEIRFFVMPPTTYSPSPTEFVHYANGGINGVMLFGIVMGSLVVIVVVAFIVAYACKWSIVQDDVNLHGIDDDEDDSTTDLTKYDKLEKQPSIAQQYDNFKVEGDK